MSTMCPKPGSLNVALGIGASSLLCGSSCALQGGWQHPCSLPVTGNDPVVQLLLAKGDELFVQGDQAS